MHNERRDRPSPDTARPAPISLPWAPGVRKMVRASHPFLPRPAPRRYRKWESLVGCLSLREGGAVETEDDGDNE
ncbi:hypothetical protein E2C01_087637 [Portunus trituberculatus]|uniref:Uncharacterized protein n=1 Tax=Portunus trituberculatus TaxID=210409 RepID=A0A5B7JJW0_PORTR|nr:hypothetical protein [Portunus trituberculatus]